ncbi:50S ribosomal protein L25 [Blochmannia endosymbiont of Colobopsis nipponica]|uniref:50S ribosomal protein L25 n=1 Tax=Blochmannia endosymbiont of Colobopsis nipponica TaxID=2681987 RepID=UPI00177D1A01|nr:50S ribosomal protein L25 [Blochmannia endosymbiont of Colobopsis nipponica]QOI10990.1 50S ribosomal protein L25 [Blochmannia endosymbiont of Colobopsis nipponica]
MMTLHATIREKKGKRASRRLRSKNLYPAILYNKQGKSVAIQLNYSKSLNIRDLQGLHGQEVILILDQNKMIAKIQEIQYHPFKNNFLHIDFFQVN